MILSEVGISSCRNLLERDFQAHIRKKGIKNGKIQQLHYYLKNLARRDRNKILV